MYGVSFKPERNTPARRLMTVDWQDYIDPRLRAVLLELGGWTTLKYNKGIVITCLNRTALENTKVGGSPRSAHLKGRAGDIRSRTFTTKQIKEILMHLEKVWSRAWLYVLAHNSGYGPHIHMNIRFSQERGRYGRSQLESTITP